MNRASIDIEVRPSRVEDFVDRKVTPGRRYFATARWGEQKRVGHASSPEVAVARAAQSIWYTVRCASCPPGTQPAMDTSR